MFTRHSFVAITTSDLATGRRFWVDQLGLGVIEEKSGDFFMVDAGGVRLCVDEAAGELVKTSETHPFLGLTARDLEAALKGLADRGVAIRKGPQSGRRGRWAEIEDPDGRRIVIEESAIRGS